MDYLRRQLVAADAVAKHRLDALLVTHLANVRYLCGFTGSSGLLLMGAGRPVFFTDGRYTEQARSEVAGARVVIAKGSPLLAAAKFAAEHKLRALGVESEHTTLAARAALKRATGDKVRLREVSAVIEKQRMVKDAEEIALIREAVNLGAALLDTAYKAIRPGVLETEIAAELEYAARRRGADAMSFDTIVAAGPRSALPHGVASANPIPQRGFVILDFGVILHGYCSDMTRTVHVGRLSTAERQMYQAVREAQQAATCAVRAGIASGQVDRTARTVLGRAGLGRYFTHSTGHGVGLEIHEPPRLGKAQKELLQPGMVVTIEPGVYVPGQGGVRIEDMLVVTDRGSEVLTPAPKDLTEL
jgi:Xaa-Pro aminopeptidase